MNQTNNIPETPIEELIEDIQVIPVVDPTNDANLDDKKHIHTPTYEREDIVASITIQEKNQKESNWWKSLMGDIYALDDPNDFSQQKKNFIILMVALGGIAGPISSMMYMPAILSIAEDLKTSISAVNGTISAFVVFMGISPLFWATLSDSYGRKRMYIYSGIITVISSIISAVSVNVGMLVVFRALQSFGSNAGLTLGAGVIADTIPVKTRGRAYGVLCQYLGWRSTCYFIAILCGILLVITALFLPETLRKPRKTKDIHLDEKHSLASTTLPTPSHASFWNTICTNFSPMLVMLHDPNNPTITETLKTVYGYNEWQTGLCYLSLGAGFMLGSMASGYHSDYILKKLSNKSNTGYLIYGWSTQKHLGVYVPLVGLFLYALGQMWAITPVQVYLVDSKPGYSATAVGLNSCVRCLVGAVTTLFSSTAIHALGNGIVFTILAVLGLLNAGFVIVCYLYGMKWRRKFEEKHMPDLYFLTNDIKEEKVNDNDELEKVHSNACVA
ncbi:MAG: major facilitator superfamily domain-containing protein [Benjaminiella poitrasii]|nr:MAG: major facilitator superfamily domain-containing protein [Benjaminiella poitrasii]